MTTIILNQKKVRKLAAYVSEANKGKELTVLVHSSAISEQQVQRLGLTWPLVVGESIVPSPIGPCTRFNSNGKEIVLRTEPKETLYREFEFTRQEWRGDTTTEVTDCCWVPYQRYPRKLIPPPGLTLQVIKGDDDKPAISAGSYIYRGVDDVELLHAVNLVLECFGQCFLYNGIGLIFPPVLVSLNWNVLPKGRMPWAVLAQHLKGKLSKQAPNTLAASIKRLEAINSLGPDFLAIGQGGYSGYVVFGFEQLELYVLESQYTNNAIYVFGDDWAVLSQKSKAEIINSTHYFSRIIHQKDWFQKLKLLLGR